MDEVSVRKLLKDYNDARRKKNRDAEPFYLKSIDPNRFVAVLEYDDEIVSLQFPKDKNSIWFCTEPFWLATDLNAAMLIKMLDFGGILDFIVEKVDRRNALQTSLGVSMLEASAASLAGSINDLGISGTFGTAFALSENDLLDLRSQVSEAQEILGHGALEMNDDLGSVRMELNVWNMMNPETATNLGFVKGEPTVVKFGFESSSTPHVSVFQRINEDSYGVVHHFRNILNHFVRHWHGDREVLQKVAKRAPALTKMAPMPPPESSPVAAPEKTKKKNWLKQATEKFRPSEEFTTLIITEESLSVLLEMGFDPISSTRALLKTKNDPQAASVLLLANPNKYRAKADELASLARVRDMGYPLPMSCVALIKCNFEADDAGHLCLQPAQVWKVKVKGKMFKDKGKEEKPKERENMFLSLLDYLQERMGRYESYCCSCQAPHSCTFSNGAGVVCSEPLCVFQLEGTPLEKLISVHLCPFKDCEHLDLSTVGKEFLGRPLDEICKEYSLTGPQLLELLLHRYLPTDQIKRLLEEGMRQISCHRLESVLNPSLCARFEHAWKAMRENRSDMKIAPSVCYHGTSEAAVKGILETGFLLNKISQGSGDYGWYGRGIYFSQYVTTALGYSRGRQMMVCAVLMGKIYKCPGRMDGAELVEGYDSHESPDLHEWVVFDETHILPVYVIHY